MVYKEEDLEMLPQIYQRVMSSQNNLKRFLKEDEIVKYSNGWNQLSSKHHIKKVKDWNIKKREERKEEAPVASARKPQANQPTQEGKKNKKKNWRKPYYSGYRMPIIQKDSMDNVFNLPRTLMEFKYKPEQRMRKPHLPKKKPCLLILLIL
ncbi:hypothetical protein O181_042482 [Austropuccinia psidii MF-1]|uniref:Uncharacterized protein n=1 Tax=Austropuccinia psidii MF-1 TaxID=1389203 RepID=A0A9Q3HFX0_9BASI|nr:hypothetical protein [Austropuccinia psidii MF-1]